MEKRSIAALKELFKENKLNDTDINELKKDSRKGVQQLIQQYEKQQLKELALERLYDEMCTYERDNRANGKKFIAGVDEAGRGPLAGPVVAAAVILPVDFKLLGLNDSKQLSEAKREAYYDIITNQAISYEIAIIDNETIDRKNIFEATKHAMKEAIQKLSPPADHVLIDAVELMGLPCSSESIIKGDMKSVSIAAASILAKVTRDRLMKEIHQAYPMYDFASNMGYGTKQHINSIKEHGISPYHRKSFAPVREYM